ncbi:1845_t:CDS:2 [Rhizophagus irregularis]|nr:1845_t:CDS:2 [Rhizophagus irregularis]
MSVYPGQDTLISYLKKQSNKSYRGFLKLHHDIIMNSLTSDLKWYNLDNAWASNYIREAEKIFVDQQVIETLKKRELQAYWQRVIKEYEKENLVPKKKSHSKDTIKVLTKDLSETSQ